jgi:hypothetical protein
VLGIADAPSLIKVIAEAPQDHTKDTGYSSEAYEWYSMSKRWQQRFENIQKAKQLSDDIYHNAHDKGGEMDRSGTMDIRHDIIPHLKNLLVVDCVLEQHGVVKRIDQTALHKLESIMMDYLVESVPVIARSHMLSLER